MLMQENLNGIGNILCLTSYRTKGLSGPRASYLYILTQSLPIASHSSSIYSWAHSTPTIEAINKPGKGKTSWPPH